MRSVRGELLRLKYPSAREQEEPVRVGPVADKSLRPHPTCPESLSFEAQPNGKASPLVYPEGSRTIVVVVVLVVDIFLFLKYCLKRWGLSIGAHLTGGSAK